MHTNLQRGFETFEERMRLKQIKQGEPVLLTSVEGKQHEWHFSCSGASFHSLLCCNNCCCLLALCEQEKRFDRTSPHLSRVRPWRTESASDIPALTGEEVRVWVRTGRRIIEGKGVVQGSWRPRYWTGFMLCKVNRIWMDRTCDPLQVLWMNDLCHHCFIMSDYE